MPSNLVRTEADERAWNAAKAKVGSRYGNTGKHWGTIVKIFQRIKRKRAR